MGARGAAISRGSAGQSSLPGLTRQSMGTLSMDARVEPAHDDNWGTTGFRFPTIRASVHYE